MTDQPSLFDSVRTLTPAEEARDTAIAKVAIGAPSGWMVQALATIKHLARTEAFFTTDDVWDLIPPPPEPRALGAAMKVATGKGWIVATDRTQKSKRVECHARPVRIWRGLLNVTEANAA